MKLTALDRYECRVEGMLLLEEFPGTIQVLHDSVQSLHDACQELLTNKGFKNFLKLVLVSGNFLNAVSFRNLLQIFTFSLYLNFVLTKMSHVVYLNSYAYIYTH